jgi:zinc protease
MVTTVPLPARCRALALLACALACLVPPRPPPLCAAPEAARPQRLANGLEVLVTPLPEATRTALVLVLRVGERHDPPGKSGLTHLTEHLFVTSPAGAPSETAAADARVPGRTVEELMSRYRDGHTAQTSDVHTMVGMVFPPERLDEELRELALRLGALDVRAEDLQREQARVLAEVGNMFEGMPALMAFNRARELALPTPEGGRRAGLPAHVKALTLEDVRGHAARCFRAGNAVLSLAGPVDAAKARATIESCFAALPAGEHPTPTPRAPAPTGPRLEVLALPPGGDARARVTLAYAAPAPDHADYPAFVLLASRLVDLKAPAREFPPPFYFAPLDEPGACYVSAELEPEETAEAAVARVQRRVNAAVGAPPTAADAFRALNVYGLLLGLAPAPAQVAAANPYLAAMAPAARHVLGLDPARLQRAFAQVRSLATSEVAARVFDPLAAGAAVVR